MAIKGALPDVNEPKDQESVFSGEVGHLECTASGVDEFGGEADVDMELYTNGQKWLNTALSKNYKADPEAIGNEEVQVDTYSKKTGMDQGKPSKCGVIQNGNHRTIWGFYHNKKIEITTTSSLGGGLNGTARKKKFDAMKYSTPT
jgi:hypothetical protein